jgi:hypothetical protein
MTTILAKNRNTTNRIIMTSIGDSPVSLGRRMTVWASVEYNFRDEPVRSCFFS